MKWMNEENNALISQLGQQCTKKEKIKIKHDTHFKLWSGCSCCAGTGVLFGDLILGSIRFEKY